ncbi:molybdopterin-dependent oxidoreductase [Lachnoclostridium pacaense]|uniref:molybdopterin-containing oxidoreductase family protein n=1 Tax=Enterocloster hominis (ex Hitch et al. 2024) TaxID=1917870 RepID=UPI001D11A0C3|nr:molybdopterin-dependent oxidoreductase [Lachnoclostridium pacaense]MCC2819285.1 molybdopterin-dependent oxidoreductase [Lachnoclostridium pacaense]
MYSREELIKAKIPCKETGIEVKKGMCAICSPGNHCGLDVYVRDGRILKVEGTKEHPFNQGYICTKGAMNKEYVYRKDRIKTPLRRVGQRGEGIFKPITWEEAYSEIAEKLNGIKDRYGADSVAFTSGYCKWYRPYYHRFVYAFGSCNFSTDDCSCYRASVLAGACTCARDSRPDNKNAGTFLGWAWSGAYSNHLSYRGVQALKERGGKVIIVDPRITPASEHLADIFLQINPGTDAALALGMAKIILDHGWEDREYIDKYTYGYKAFAERVKGWNLERVAEITGLNPADIMEATRIYATNGPASCNIPASALAHEINGFQDMRAFLCLQALLGNIDRKGGNVPEVQNTYLNRNANFAARESEYYMENAPDLTRMIAYDRFPIWSKFCHEFQAMALADAILDEDPYPIKAIYGVGMNFKMYPQTEKLVKALDNIDFFVNTDLFMSYTCKYADIVLPCCSSLERGEFKVYPGGYGVYTDPVIEPLYQSKSDTDILCELANYMELPDELLRKGYEASIDYIMDGCGLTVADFKKTPGIPQKMPGAKPCPPGYWLEKGFPTPSGKIEFYSQTIAEYEKDFGLDPLPDYIPPLSDDEDEAYSKEYPFMLCSGTRLPHTIHSRLHEVSWSRYIRREPLVEIHEKDAGILGIGEGDRVELYSPYGCIAAKAMLTAKIHEGTLQIGHGYTEANSSILMSDRHLDPYSGFPGYKVMRCSIRKAGKDIEKADCI